MEKKIYIEIIDKKLCSGCTACMSICPKQCISMQEDEEGFLYPKVDTERCIQCSKCVKVCPYANSEFTDKSEEEELALCYAAYYNNEEIRYKSSSGGMFRAFADQIIAEGGVVFGAAFDENFLVEHTCSETLEGLTAFMGSKYLQSRMGDSYNRVKLYLDQGRKVLFTGCGCQIAGLKRFLNGKDENLICVDLICHGVDSPKIWIDYLHSLLPNDEIKSVNFRDKITGQDDSTVSIIGYKSSLRIKEKKNLYFRSWIFGLFARPSCEICPFKKDNRISDITISDCWGFQKIAPEMFDNRGLSSVVVHTEKGRNLFTTVAPHLVFKETLLDDVKRYNSDYIKSNPFNHRMRVDFWKEYLSHKKPLYLLLEKYLKESLIHKISKSVKKNIRTCLSLLKKF